jgi:hypothetical protein
MVLKFLCIDDRQEKRKDDSVHRILTLADQSRPALTHTLAYEPKGEDLTKLPPEGKAVDLEIDLAVRAIKWNNFQLLQEISVGSVIIVHGTNGSSSGKNPVGK